jgi:iron complex outermembrane receptor protein
MFVHSSHRSPARGHSHLTQNRIAVAVLSALAAAAAHGQESGGLEEVLVTAQRRSEDIQKVPMSVQAFDSSALENLNIRTTDELQFATPGFVNTATAGDGISAIFIRGVGTGYSGPGLEGSVATYVDDVYLQTQTVSAQNTIDLAQVQVLKGPQGTLYGRNATGGAVVITTADPVLGKYEGYVKGGFGNLDWGRGEAVMNLPLGDTMALRFAGFYERRDGYVKNVAVDDFKKSGVGAGETYGGRVKLLVQPSDALKIVGKLSYDRRDGNGAIHSLRYTPTGDRTDLGWHETAQSPNREGGGGDDTSAKAASVRVEYTSGIWTLSNTLGYRQTRAYGCTDNDGVVDELLYFCTVSQRSPNPGDAHGKQDRTLTNEFRIVSSSDGPFDLTAGLFFERNRAQFVGRIGGDFFGALTPTFDNHDRLKAYSGYVEGYWKMTDRWKLTAGGRYTHEKKVHTNEDDADAIALLGGFDGSGRQSTSFSNFSPRLVVSYDADQFNYYASVSRGFKSGGFNSPSLTLDPKLKPEKITALEVGTKYRSDDRRLRANAAAFAYDWKDVQVAFITGGGAGIQQQNAAKSRIYGGELSVDFVPTNALSLNAGLAYTHARFKRFPNAAVYNLLPTLTADAEDLKGHRLPWAPDFTANASATYDFDLSSGWSADVTLAGRYSTKYDFTAGAGGELRAARQDAFGLVNLTGNFYTPSKSIELGWFVNNLFDENYISLISTGNTGVYMTPAEPRVYGATLRYNF